MGPTPRNISTIPSGARPPSVILSAHYFLYFGMMGIFLPFFNLFCHNIGLSGFEIGAINSTRTVVMVLFSILWGALADRLALRRPVFILTSFLSALAFGGYLFTDTFLPMLGVTVVYALFFGPVIPFLEAFTMEALNRPGADPNAYGRIRAWGSLSFIGVVMVMGRVMEISSTRLVPPLILLASLMLALCTPAMPRDLSPLKPAGTSEIKSLFNRRTLGFLLANFLMLAGHGTYYGFFSIHLEQTGYGPGFIGLAWALATLAELAVMTGSSRIFKHLPIHRALWIACLLAALRWVVLFAFTSPAAILLSQLLHAATYALFHIACILYTDRLSTPGNRTVAQVANNAVSYGLGLMAGFLVNGWLYDRYGAGLFLMSAGISLGAAALLFLVASRSPRP
ncbi:MFS transporter [Desulfoluna butyratoxydans]|uniref:Major facilitator superfamily domain n=1 Tax=Desulfoluna butyratoxydans TaxID=231438 RepID=A0A4U8YJN2_9BACT|nr:MFS transporter [Desulfoluna butyratoxydans]VFQ43640.1 major facilitator superfamily domain [Desulfoluna butyratoxydans]